MKPLPKLSLHKHWQNDEIQNPCCLQCLCVWGGGAPWQSLWVGVWQICWGERRKQPHWSPIHITPHLHNHTHTHTPSQKKSKVPVWLAIAQHGGGQRHGTHEQIVTWSLLASPQREAWQRLKKLYIPPSVTDQQGQTPHLSLAVILLSNTSHRPQAYGELASQLFSSEKTPMTCICIYQDLAYTKVKEKSYQAMHKSWKQQYISELT